MNFVYLQTKENKPDSEKPSNEESDNEEPGSVKLGAKPNGSESKEPLPEQQDEIKSNISNLSNLSNNALRVARYVNDDDKKASEESQMCSRASQVKTQKQKPKNPLVAQFEDYQGQSMISVDKVWCIFLFSCDCHKQYNTIQYNTMQMLSSDITQKKDLDVVQNLTPEQLALAVCDWHNIVLSEKNRDNPTFASRFLSTVDEFHPYAVDTYYS
ncbi:hypothetical protein RFI_09182, partial [Reticulomyxa filosa]